MAEAMVYILRHRFQTLALLSSKPQGKMDTPFSAYKHLQALSNELSTPLIVRCPADDRRAAKSFVDLTNSRLSYFVGVYASEHLSASLVSGDRNLTNGTQARMGF